MSNKHFSLKDIDKETSVRLSEKFPSEWDMDRIFEASYKKFLSAGGTEENSTDSVVFPVERDNSGSKRTIITITRFAACLCLIAGVVSAAVFMTGNEPESPEDPIKTPFLTDNNNNEATTVSDTETTKTPNIDGSTDNSVNVPPLEKICTMSNEEALNALAPFTREDIHNAWGDNDSETFGRFVEMWYCGDMVAAIEFFTYFGRPEVVPFHVYIYDKNNPGNGIAIPLEPVTTAPVEGTTAHADNTTTPVSAAANGANTGTNVPAQVVTTARTASISVNITSTAAKTSAKTTSATARPVTTTVKTTETTPPVTTTEKDQHSSVNGIFTITTAEPSSEGVDEFIELCREQGVSLNSYDPKHYFNKTPTDIAEKYGIKIITYWHNDRYLVYKGKVFTLGSLFGNEYYDSFAVADMDNNGAPELYFQNSSGSGLDSRHFMYVDLGTMDYDILGSANRNLEEYCFIKYNNRLMIQQYDRKYIDGQEKYVAEDISAEIIYRNNYFDLIIPEGSRISVPDHVTMPDKWYDIETDLPKDIPFEAQYIRTESKNGSYPNKMECFWISSKRAIEDYCFDHKDDYDLDSGFGSSISFKEAVAKYDSEDYFRTHDLLVIKCQETSGSTRHNIKSLTISSNDSNNGYYIKPVIERINPGEGTADMAEWHIIIEVDKRYGSFYSEISEPEIR